MSAIEAYKPEANTRLCPFEPGALVCFVEKAPPGWAQSIVDGWVSHHGRGPHLVAAVHPLPANQEQAQTVSVVGSIWAHTWFRLATEAERATLVGPK